MKSTYRNLEAKFEKLSYIVMTILGNSITFIAALCLVIAWFFSKEFYHQSIHKSIGDIILGITFLSLFVIQKTFNRFSISLQIKLNELVASNDRANNEIINIEEKTEHELSELTKEYAELAGLAKTIENKRTSINNDKQI